MPTDPKSDDVITTQPETKLNEFASHYRFEYRCVNCKTTGLVYIKRARRVADVTITCSNCGCPAR